MPKEKILVCKYCLYPLYPLSISNNIFKVLCDNPYKLKHICMTYVS